MTDSLYGLFARAAARYPSRIALLRKVEGAYAGMTYADLKARVDAVAADLRRSGIGCGDAVGILSGNRPEWVVADLAVLACGGVVVPIYDTLPPATTGYILRDSGMKLLFVEDEALRARVEPLRAGAPALREVRVFDAGGDAPPVAAGPAAPQGKGGPGPDDLATIVYTSGTTGEPKGVMLTHGNIAFDARAAIDRFRIDADDVFFSYLPLSHMLEKTCGNYVALFSGASIAYAGDRATMVDDIRAVRPTTLLTVPRAVEKVFETVLKRVEEGGRIRRALVNAAVDNLNERANRLFRGEKVPLVLDLKCAALDRLIASKFRAIIGDRVRIIVSGGAPLDRKLAKVLLVLGFPIVEGYGLTETAPVVASGRLEDNRLGTVGKPLPGVEVRIGDESEILVRGPNVMRGYYNKPEETARVLDGDGWFHTGDQGRFDDDGNLVITGRIKELIVTSYGKNVAPVPIEAEIAKSPLVETAMLVGDKRKYITALLVPRRDALAAFARERGLAPADDETLLSAREIRDRVAEEIERINAGLAPFEKVRRFHLVGEAPSVDNGLLTPTLKLKRGTMAERHATAIEAMYAEH